MAGEYMYQDESVTAAPTRFEKILRVIIVLAVLGLGVQLVWLVGISPFRTFSRIDVVGFEGMDKAEILAKAGIGKTSSYFSTDVKAVEKALGGISIIEKARVIKHFPDKLQILLEPRQAVASALAWADGMVIPVVFDGQGVIFEVGGREAKQSGRNMVSQLPLVSGLIIENPFPGMRLPAAFIPVFRELEKINASAPELLDAVSEVRINRKPFDSYDLVLYPMHKKVKVRLSELNEDLLRYTLLMVDVLAAKEPGIGTLDFRAGIASYKPLEVSSE